MTVSKRTRFEVLRRDSHACQYCGQMAPDVALTIDHVMPVSLGGSDLPDNLITACKDCNAGKASIAPDSPLVAALGDRAAAYALGMLDKMTRLRATLEEADKFATEFSAQWVGWRDHEGKPVPMPYDWESTLHRWFRMGVPMRMLELAIPKAMALTFPKGEHGRFRYLCGVIWNQIDSEDIDYSLTTDTVAVFTEAERDAAADESWGWATDRAEFNFEARDFVRHHIDGTTSDTIDRRLRVA